MSEASVMQGLPIGQNVGVLIAIPNGGRRLPLEMVIALACQSAPTHMTSGYLGIKNAPIEKARELAAENAIKAGAKYLWFVDDDTVPPPNTLKRLIYILDNYPDVGIVGGIYVTRDTVVPQPLVFRGMGNGSFWKWKVGDIFEVTGMGAGCMLIRVDMLEKLPKPWFTFENFDSYDSTVASNMISEDIHFCNLVRNAGYKVVAHGGILCDHWDDKEDKVYRLPEDSYPMRPVDTPPVVVPQPEPPQELPKIKNTRKNKNV